jgi:hypothetical protein
VKALLAVLLLLLASCQASGPSQTTTTTATPATTATTTTARAAVSGPCRAAAPPAQWQHVVWIVMENRGLSEVHTPYVTQLAAECGSASNYSGISHPSLPNYLALTSGSTHGVGDDGGPSEHPIKGPSIFSVVGSWRSLEESMPSPCDHASSGQYAAKHNPAVYYVDLPGCASNDVALGAVPDLSARFTFITPNICHDMHDCSTSTGDQWLSREMAQILGSTEYRRGSTAVFITWDENDSGGALVPLYVVAPSVAPGTRVGAALSHYSLLRATQEMLGLTPSLGASVSAPSLRAPFHL